MHIDESEYKLKFSVECFITCNDKILLFKRSSSAKNFPNFWSIPGGHLDLDEDVLTACIREVKEETGIEVDNKNVKLKYIAHHKHRDRQEVWNIFGFKVELENKMKITDSDEGESAWVKIDELENIELFPPIKIHVNHAITKNSGLLYIASDLENLKVTKTYTKNIDLDY